MGLRFAFLIYSQTGHLDLTRPVDDPSEAEKVMSRLFPRTPYVPSTSARLLDVCFPEREEPAVGVFDDGVLIATRDAHLYDPDILHRRYFKAVDRPDLQLVTSRSYNDMVAYGHWRRGELVRCLSMNAVAGVWRNEGDHGLPVEQIPPTPDRWLDTANAILAATLGLAGDAAPHVPGQVDWDDVVMQRFRRADR